MYKNYTRNFGVPKDAAYKLLRIMRLTTLILIAAIMQVSASGLAQKISMYKSNADLKTVLKELRVQSGYNFVYTENLLRKSKPVNIKVKDELLKDVLEMIFNDQQLTYSIDSKTVIVKPKESSFLDKIDLFKTIDVKGKIVDEKGEPIPGATIKIKGTKQSIVSSDNGDFHLKNVDESAVLQISYIGFTPLEVPVKSDMGLIKMKELDSKLEEVTVVAYGTQKKASLVSSITTIKPEELKVPSSNLTTALAGRIAGLVSYQRSGEPGADNANFFIRGVTTFGYNANPLILIDNIELTTTDLARLQVDDIESFSIMKDASATALYGARGANGVILVTTKRGKAGETTISFRLEKSVSTPTRNVELADPITYMQLGNEAVLTRNPLGTILYSDEKINNTVIGSNSILFPATDWLKLLLKDYTSNQRANLNITGGGNVARFFVSGSFNQDNGILNVDKRNNFNSNIDLKSYSLRSNVDMDLTKTTLLTVRLSGSFDDYRGPLNGGAIVYNDIMHTNPVLFPAYYETDPAHSFLKHILFGNYGTGGYRNPYADMVSGYKQTGRSMLLTQTELKQKLDFITNGLSLRTMLNLTRTSSFGTSRRYNPFYYALGGYDIQTGAYTLNDLNPNSGTEYLGYNPEANALNSTFYSETALNYGNSFGEKHDVSGLLVYIMRNNLSANPSGFLQSLPYRNLGLSGRTTYGYDSRYYFEFNFGYNGSERFHESKRFGFFPSVGLAWSIADEKFMKNVTAISKLKLRATYGIGGNDAIGDATQRFYYLSNVNLNADNGASFGTNQGNYSQSGVSVTRYANNNITWETSRKLNLGMELGLFNDFNFVAEYYTDDRRNILMNRPDIADMGLTAGIMANVGRSKGSGIDLSMEGNKRFSNDFSIQTRANFTFARSKIITYEEPKYDEPYRSNVGYSTSQLWGLVAERLFVDDQDAANSPRQNFGDYAGGDIKYMDINGDDQITERDHVPLGYPTTPEVIYGFGASATYKNFDVSFFAQGSGQSSFFIDPWNTSPFNNHTQLLKAYADSHWSESNRDIYALWPRLSTSTISNNNQVSTWWMRNGSFLRLKQVELGYKLKNSLLERLNVGNFRLYVNATNLFVLSSFKLWDVEMAGSGLGYPTQRVFNLGINVHFK